jgi:hypothetical protein
MVAQEYTGSAIVKIHRFSRDLTDRQSAWQLPLMQTACFGMSGPIWKWVEGCLEIPWRRGQSKGTTELGSRIYCCLRVRVNYNITLNLEARQYLHDKNKQEFRGHLRDEALLNLAEAVQSSSRVAVTDPYLLSTLLQMQGGNTFKTSAC